MTAPLETSEQRPQELVATESQKRIRDHLRREARYNPTKSLTALTGQLTQEYEDRFLVELIQNAYDAHDPGVRDGRVHIRLDEAGPGGPILYVANTGNAFANENFDALTNVAQSSKPPGEGIGNKGIGFRSVLQVCDFPEIYSCSPGAPAGSPFDGFCFGFATDEQIRNMVANEAEYEVIKADFSRYLLPVVAEPTDPCLDELRALGVVTVIRLPLSGARAVELAREQVQRLYEPAPPIALFLDRLSMIIVEHVNEDGARLFTEVERSVQEITVPPGGPSLSWITTAGQRFLMATRTLRAAEVAEVVRAAVAKNELDASWTTWSSDVDVSLAVQLDGEPEANAPSTYTYLPMRVPSPLHAHLHAPFHTKLARLDLKEQTLFNAFLIRTAASVAASTVGWLAGEARIGLNAADRRAAVVDLLCWDAQHLGVFRSAMEQAGMDLQTSPLVPALNRDGATWGALAGVRVWQSDGLEILTTDGLRAHAPLLDPSLGGRRIKRLQDFAAQAVSNRLDPSDDEVAGWVESIARAMESASPAKWNRFLGEVADVFGTRKPAALGGRFILLDEKRKLRRSGPWDARNVSATEPTVFIPPRPVRAKDAMNGDDEVASVPKNLQRAITFLHPAIKVRIRVRNTFQRTPVGELFKNADLVEQYELAEILAHLGRLLTGKVSDTTYRQALSWVYAQEQASRANVAELARLGLHVPTAAGWLPAARAVFSPGWGTPRAEAVAGLVRDAGEHSPALRALGQSALVHPDRWPFKLRNRQAFKSFLARCGVRDGLYPIPLRSRTAVRMNGIHFNATVIAPRYGLADHEAWGQHIAAIWPAQLIGPYTPYTGQQDLWVVPGQDTFADLEAHAKDRLAAAILETLEDWPEQTLRYTFQRRSSHHQSKPDVQQWPSPARTFVETGSWFPMSDPGRRREPYFVQISDAWTFDETGGDAAPRFAALAPIEHRRRLAASPATADRLRRAGLKTWNRKGSAAARLAELARLVGSGSVLPAELMSVERAARAAWTDLVSLPPASLPPDLALVVTRGHSLGFLLPLASAPPEVFVADVAPGLVGQVLEAGDFPVLVADPPHGPEIIARLGALAGFGVRATSTVQARAVLDGRELDPGPDTGEPLLDVFGSWLVRTVLAIVDLRSSRFVRVTNRVLHEAEARLRRMRIALGTRIELAVDGRTLPPAGRLADSVHLDDPDHPLVVVNRHELEVPSWRALEVIADDLAELLKQSQTASEIRAAALSLQRSVDTWREPTDTELAKALRCTPESVTEVLHNLRTSTDHLRLLLGPFVGVHVGVEGTRRIEAQPVDDLRELKGLTAELIGDEPAEALFASAERAEKLDDIRRELGTDLGALNRVLRELNRQMLTFEPLHRAALTSYVEEHRIDALGSLRRRFRARFEARGDLSAYVAARDFRDLTPDPAWLPDYESPPEALLRERLATWLDTQGDPADPRELAPIDDVRTENRTTLDRVLPTAADVVVAWSSKRDVEPTEIWAELQQVRDRLAEAGGLDFVALTEPALLQWLQTLGLWPADMPVTLDLVRLGVTEEDIADARKAKTQTAQKRRRRRTELTFGDRTYDTATDELRDFALAIADSADDLFLRAPARLTRLAEISREPSGGGGGGGGGGGRGGATRAPKPTDEQTSAIGLAGEILAYRWLQQAYPEATPDSWVSRNRRFVLDGDAGNDRLGYDFRIARKNETLLFEVKATTTDEDAFDISDSELRAARGTRARWYRIIFIRSVLSPSSRELLVLPNPLDAGYAQVNQGLRLRFEGR